MLKPKQHYNSEFFHLISSIKKSLDKNQELLFFKKKNNHSKILNLLLSEGFIISFQDHQNFLIIRIKLDNRAKSIHTLVASQRIGRKNFTISFKELLMLQRREGVASYFILNTGQGLISSFEAIEKKIGGKLLLKIS